MPFCTNCGGQVAPSDRFCPRCGAPQASGSAWTGPNSAGVSDDVFPRLSPRVASMLCYVPVVGWLGSIVVLASPRFLTNRTVRFHAFQGLYLFVAWLLVEWFASPLIMMGARPWSAHALSGLLHFLVFGAWIFMLIKTSQEQVFSLPIIGELAERSVAEQRQP